VFIPVSIQTERAGHYTNFAGVVSGFEPIVRKKEGVAHAEQLFAQLTAKVEAIA
jgi:NADH-quinone oxidoreductase subunit G